MGHAARAIRLGRWKDIHLLQFIFYITQRAGPHCTAAHRGNSRCSRWPVRHWSRMSSWGVCCLISSNRSIRRSVTESKTDRKEWPTKLHPDSQIPHNIQETTEKSPLPWASNYLLIKKKFYAFTFSILLLPFIPSCPRFYYFEHWLKPG